MTRWMLIVGLLLVCGVASGQTTRPEAWGAAAGGTAAGGSRAGRPVGGPEDQGVQYYTPAAPSMDWGAHATISGGFSDVHFNGHNAIPYNPAGGYIDANMYARLPNYESPIIGFGVTASGNWDDYSINYPTAPFYRSFSASAGLYSAEVRIAVPIGLPKLDEGFYVMPRIGVGVVVENFSGGQPYYGYPNYLFGATNNHTGYGYEVRPDIEVGYLVRRFNIGLEASYMAAWGNFGKLGNLAENFQVGLVLGWRF